MDTFIEYTFRFCMYTLAGLTLETLFAVDGIDRALGFRLERRVPKKYLEGFVSVYMIPLHGLGLPEGTVPNGFAVPFHFYDDFMKHNGFYAKAAAMQKSQGFASDTDKRDHALAASAWATRSVQPPWSGGTAAASPRFGAAQRVAASRAPRSRSR